MFRRALATLLSLTISCVHAEGKSLAELDRRVSRTLEGDNSLAAVDYFMEALALGSPVIDYGATFNLWYPAQNSLYPNSSRLSTSAVLATYTLTGVAKYTIRRKKAPAPLQAPTLEHKDYTFIPFGPCGILSTLCRHLFTLSSRSETSRRRLCRRIRLQSSLCGEPLCRRCHSGSAAGSDPRYNHDNRRYHGRKHRQTVQPGAPVLFNLYFLPAAR